MWPGEAQSQDGKDGPVSQIDADVIRFVVIDPDKVIVAHRRPDHSRYQNLVPDDGVIREGIEVQHEGGKAPDTGGDEKDGEGPVKPGSVLPEDDYPQDGEKQETYQWDDNPHIHEIPLPKKARSTALRRLASLSKL